MHENENSLIREGRNAWRLSPAERLAFLVDGESYFDALARSLRQARHNILIAAWEIDDRVALTRQGGEVQRLGDLLADCLRQCPTLRVYVLAWDFAMLYAVERGLQPLFRLRFSTPRRLRLHLDSRHPVGASHHQKLVVVDGRVAFLGGLDLTRNRWDRSEHRPDDPDRVNDEGARYPPFHDVQVAVEGDAARALGEHFRERWQDATGARLSPPPDPSGEPTPWPDGLALDAEDLKVALARTRPPLDGRDEVREIEKLHLDSIAAARRSIYVENQYLSSVSVVQALGERLADPRGPEVVLVVPRRCPGWLEQQTMGLLRRQRLQELRAADPGGRLRVVYPDVPGGEDGVYVHSKVMIVDDLLARVGSANLSNRSMGFDTELDLAVESQGQERLARCVAGLRNRLLAEHLGASPESVERVIHESNGSLIAVLDRLGSADGRTLRPVDDPPLPPEMRDIAETGRDLADPESPEQPERLLTEFLSRDVPRASRSPWLKAAAVAAAIAALVGLWRFTPVGDWLAPERLASFIETLRATPLAPLGVPALYTVASILFVPITLLIVATALVFGPLSGTAYALTGVLAASAATFGLGRLLGRDVVRRASGRRLNELSRKIARQGILAVAAVRFVPVAPFTLVNLVAGASHVRFRDFLLGTGIGVTPGVLGIVLLEASLEELIRRPGPGGVLAVVGVAAVLVVLFALLRRFGGASGS